MAVVLGICPLMYLLVGAIFYFIVTGEGGLISIFITWELGGG